MKRMDRRKKNLINIVALTSMTIFSLFSVFSGAAAWFTSNQNYNGSGDNFAVRSNSGVLSSITFHQVSEVTTDDSGKPTSYVFNSEAVGTLTYDWQSNSVTPTGSASISLSDYDPLNKEHPLLLMFHFDQVYDTSAQAISIKATSEAEGFLGKKKADATPEYSLTEDIYKTENSKNYYWMSSAVQFYKTAFANDTLTYQYALTSAYATANSLPLLSASDSKFVTANNENDTCSFQEEATFYASSGESVKNVGIVIDYYPDAIEYIYSTYLGNTTLEDTYNGILHFWCDWSMEVI